MLAAVDRDLADVNPVSVDTVHRLTGPEARQDLLRELLSDDTAEQAQGAAASSGRRRPLVAPVLAAAAVAAVVFSAVSLLGDERPAGEAPVAAPAQVENGCAGAGVQGVAQVVQRLPGSTYCVHVPADAASEALPGETAPTAWSSLAVDDGSPDVLATVLVGPVPPPPADGVVVLGMTSDAFPDDVLDVDGQALSTHRVFGTAGDAVTAVDLVLPDGSTVAATLAEGVWGAWWPVETGGPDDSQVRIRTRSATITVDIDTVGLTEPPRVVEGIPEAFRQRLS